MLNLIQDILYQSYFGNSLLDYIISLSIFLLSIIFILIFKKILLNRLVTWAEKTETTIDDFLISSIKRKALPLIYYGAFYLSMKNLSLNPALTKSINVLGLALLTILGATFFTSLVLYFLENYWQQKEKGNDKTYALKVITKVVQLIVWGLAIILFLDNLGIEINALIAGLGIGGIAIAFAAQAILQDIFSYFSIFFDHPFEIGDFIIIDDYMGTVENIGLKTTRLKSINGEQLIFANTDLTNSRVRNYKRMQARRVLFTIGVTYETSLEHLKEIPGIIQNIIRSIPETTFDRSHFLSYGDFSLNYETVYYIQGNDYNKYVDIHQEINFRIKEEFDKRGIEFAYPTQTLFLKK